MKTSVAGERPKWNRCYGTALISSWTGWTRNTVPAAPAAVPALYAGTEGTAYHPRNRTTTTTTTVNQKPAANRWRRRRGAGITKITRTIIAPLVISRNDSRTTCTAPRPRSCPHVESSVAAKSRNIVKRVILAITIKTANVTTRKITTRKTKTST